MSLKNGTIKSVILKTSPRFFDQVIRAERHASPVRLKAARGSPLLLPAGSILWLAEMRVGASALIRYAMRLKLQRRPEPGEMMETFGVDHWKWLIVGECCCRVPPFD